MLFLHEVHQVAGLHEDEFEAAFREGWMPALAKNDDARLLWYTNHTVGSGVSYNVITITGVRDGAAWEHLALRIQSGDLHDWMRGVDELRHDVTGKLLLLLPWSPMQDLDLASVPTDGAAHELSMYMEDTMWPIEGKSPTTSRRRGQSTRSRSSTRPIPPTHRSSGSRPGSNRRSVRMCGGRSHSCNGSSIKSACWGC